MPPGHPKIKWAPEMSFPNRLEVKAAQRGHITSDSHTCLAGGWQWGWALVGEEEEEQSRGSHTLYSRSPPEKGNP